MKKMQCALLLLGIVLLCDIFAFGSARTAPEFTVTIDTENFKEIRIPMDLWKKIITRNYNPAGKKPTRKNIIKTNLYKEGSAEIISAALNGSELDNAYVIESPVEEVIEPTVHEVVLHIQVPEETDGEALASNSNEIAQDSIVASNLGNLAKPAIETMPIIDTMIKPAVEDSADVILSVANPVEGIEAVDGTGVSPTSVLVQTARFPCTCDKGVCGCCAIMFLQKGCANVAFLPDEFSFEMKMTMNGNVIAKRKVPVMVLVSDPPPFCFNPRRAPFLELCAQLNNIHLRKNNIHVCVDIDASVGGFDLFSWTFNCLKFGNQGIVTGLNPETATKAGRPQEESGIFGDFFGGGSESEGDDSEDDDSDEGGLLDGIFGDDDDDY